MAKTKEQAESFCPPKHRVFLVSTTKIKDSVGTYCNVGDYAVLSEKMAKSYLKRKMIVVDLPSFDDEDDEIDNADIEAGPVENMLDTDDKNKPEAEAKPRRRAVRS